MNSDDEDEHQGLLSPVAGGQNPDGSGTPPLDDAAVASLRQRRRAEVFAMAKLNVAIAMLNAGYWPTEMLKTPIFGAVGYNSSSLIYLFFGLFAFFTPLLVNRIGNKWTVAIGAVFYAVFLLTTEALLYFVGTIDDPRWSIDSPVRLAAIVLYYFGSILLGMAASPLRTGSSVYVRARAMGYDAARLPGSKAKNSLGTFAGINSAAFGVSSFVFVSLIGAAVSNGVDYRNLYWVCFASISASLPLFFTVATTDSIARCNPVPPSLLTRDPKPSTVDGCGRQADEEHVNHVGVCSVCDLFRSSSKLRWLLVPSVSSAVQSSYFVGSFNADVIAVAVGLEWVGWCSAIEIVIGSSIAPIVGRLSDFYGRLPFYFFGLTINICSALYVALVGANMTATSIVIFSVLRGFSQATGAVMQAIFSEEFNDEEVRDIHQQNVACSSFFFALQVLAGFAIFTTAAFSASTVLGMLGSSTMFAIGPFFAIETKSLMVAVGAMCAGFSVFMAVGRRVCCNENARTD